MPSSAQISALPISAIYPDSAVDRNSFSTVLAVARLKLLSAGKALQVMGPSFKPLAEVHGYRYLESLQLFSSWNAAWHLSSFQIL